ncbi:hypothetical protein TNCV_3398781 [Trichonephila clavipes]|nr:hypothetical protein TNCV_3398781 [Trichonephila clavipes]
MSLQIQSTKYLPLLAQNLCTEKLQLAARAAPCVPLRANSWAHVRRDVLLPLETRRRPAASREMDTRGSRPPSWGSARRKKKKYQVKSSSSDSPKGTSCSELVDINSTEVQRPHIGTVWKFEECGISTAVDLTPRLWINILSSSTSSPQSTTQKNS